MSNRTIRLAAAAVLSILMAPAAPPATAQTFKDAMAAYERSDYAVAFAGFRILAAQGNADARFGLGVMYEDGKGVPRDHVRAHMWFNLAAARFPATEKDRRTKAIWNRDRVARLLSPGALARAQRLAREWKPGAGAGPVSPPPEARNGGMDARSRIVAIQLALARLGYQPGPADGVLGQKTRAAIRAFQASAGLPVDGRPLDRLKRALALAEAKAAPAPKPAPAGPAPARASTGSGFRVSADGRVLTNAHVVRGCAEVRVPPVGPATVAARDEAADLALIDGPSGAAAAFRQGRGVRLSAPIVVVGYPLRGVLAAGANVSTGSVAALAGIRGDRRKIQITAPVQPGNSGGPVLDAAGNAVGVVVSRLDALRMARATGRVPQNVNFAVSAAAARAFLDSEGAPYETASSNRARAPEEVAAAAKAFTVLIECWK